MIRSGPGLSPGPQTNRSVSPVRLPHPNSRPSRTARRISAHDDRSTTRVREARDLPVRGIPPLQGAHRFSAAEHNRQEPKGGAASLELAAVSAPTAGGPEGRALAILHPPPGADLESNRTGPPSDRSTPNGEHQRHRSGRHPGTARNRTVPAIFTCPSTCVSGRTLCTPGLEPVGAPPVRFPWSVGVRERALSRLPWSAGCGRGLVSACPVYIDDLCAQPGSVA